MDIKETIERLKGEAEQLMQTISNRSIDIHALKTENDWDKRRLKLVLAQLAELK